MNDTPAQTAPSTPSTTQASKTQAKKVAEPAYEVDFKKELQIRIHEAQCMPPMLLVPKMTMQGSTDAKLRVATRFMLQKVEWMDVDGNKNEAELGDAFKSVSQYYIPRAGGGKVSTACGGRFVSTMARRTRGVRGRRPADTRQWSASAGSDATWRRLDVRRGLPVGWRAVGGAFRLR